MGRGVRDSSEGEPAAQQEMDSAVLLHLASLAWRVMAPSCSLEEGLDNSKTELVTLKSTIIFIMYALLQCLSFSERTAGTLHSN